MMSPSFYRTIHTQPEMKVSPIYKRYTVAVRRHALKLIVCAMLFVLLFTSFLLIGTKASGSKNAVAAVNEELVTVFTGDTLWGIANRFASEKEDIRYVIYLIKERNGLESTDLYPGQKLVIPSI